MLKAICDLYGNRMNFKGRSSRSNFFVASLVSLILLVLIWLGSIGAGCAVCDLLDVYDYCDIISDVIFWVAAAFVLAPLAAITARRINDYGHDPRPFLRIVLVLGIVILVVSFVARFVGSPYAHVFISVVSLLAYLLIMLCLSVIPSKDVITKHGVPAGNVKTGFADVLTDWEVERFSDPNSNMKYCRFCGRATSSYVEMCTYCLAVNGEDGRMPKAGPHTFKHVVFSIIALFLFNRLVGDCGFSAYEYMCGRWLDNVEKFCSKGSKGWYQDVNSNDVAAYLRQSSFSEAEPSVAPAASEPEHAEPESSDARESAAPEANREVARSASATSSERKMEDALVAVDLGLPSGTKWAKCNLGAKRETAYGNYYHAEQVDAAIRKALGYGWAAPTAEQTTELVNLCSRRWCTSYNGKAVTGFLFTGPNGNSIFLPAAGNKKNGKKRRVGTDGDYWTSSTLRSGRYQNIDFTSGSILPADDSPSSMQFTVRPVAIN